MADTPVAEVNGLAKTYSVGFLRAQRIQALRDVTLTIGRGQVFGLIGPNRAGKTTLVKILLSLCRPSAGQAFRFGQPVSERRTLARVGYVHENQALPRYWDAAGLLAYYGALSLLPEPEVRARVPRLLAQVGLADRSREPVRNFSKGMLQRLGLAQALLNDPELLVMDEPTEGLDLEGRQVVAQIVNQRRGKGGTVVLVSHALAEIEELCDRVAVLVGGRVVYAGSVSGLRREGRPLAECVRGLYGNGP